MRVDEFDQSSTLLLPGQIDLLTDTELSMYFIQSWELTFVSKSCTVVHCPPLPLQLFSRHQHSWLQQSIIIRVFFRPG